MFPSVLYDIKYKKHDNKIDNKNQINRHKNIDNSFDDWFLTLLMNILN